jgi:hypothetical protein
MSGMLNVAAASAFGAKAAKRTIKDNKTIKVLFFIFLRFLPCII